jgi:hypothetical protein
MSPRTAPQLSSCAQIQGAVSRGHSTIRRAKFQTKHHPATTMWSSMPREYQCRQEQFILSIQSGNRSNNVDACSIKAFISYTHSADDRDTHKALGIIAENREVSLTRLIFKCPNTKRLVPTHVDIDLAEIDRLPDRVTYSRCLYCDTVHGWRPKETFVSEELPIGRSRQ